MENGAAFSSRRKHPRAVSAAPRRILEFGSSYTIADGAQFAGAGLIRINNATTTTISGTINNTGTVLINSIGSFTDFV